MCGASGRDLAPIALTLAFAFSRPMARSCSRRLRVLLDSDVRRRPVDLSDLDAVGRGEVLGHDGLWARLSGGLLELCPGVGTQQRARSGAVLVSHGRVELLRLRPSPRRFGSRSNRHGPRSRDRDDCRVRSRRPAPRCLSRHPRSPQPPAGHHRAWAARRGRRKWSSQPVTRPGLCHQTYRCSGGMSLPARIRAPERNAATASAPLCRGSQPSSRSARSVARTGSRMKASYSSGGTGASRPRKPPARAARTTPEGTSTNDNTAGNFRHDLGHRF